MPSDDDNILGCGLFGVLCLIVGGIMIGVGSNVTTNHSDEIRINSIRDCETQPCLEQYLMTRKNFSCAQWVDFIETHQNADLYPPTQQCASACNNGFCLANETLVCYSTCLSDWKKWENANDTTKDYSKPIVIAGFVLLVPGVICTFLCFFGVVLMGSMR